jgi:hypothetical protein
MNKQPKKSIKLALQGGGSHGAFAWGVLYRLLEAVSGTSAGIERGRGPTKRRIYGGARWNPAPRGDCGPSETRREAAALHARRNDRDRTRTAPRSALTMADLRDHQR